MAPDIFFELKNFNFDEFFSALDQRHRRDPGASNASEAAHRTPPGSFALCESEASATKRPVGTEINHTFW